MIESHKPRHEFKNLISHTLFIIALLFCFFFLLSSSASSPITPPPVCYPLEGGWEVDTSDNHYVFHDSLENVTASPDDTVVAKSILPLVYPVNTAIYFRSSQQSVTVKINGVILYEYDTNGKQPFGKATASHWNFVSLPPGSEGAVLEIALSSPYPHYSGHFSTIYFGSYESLIGNLFSEYFWGYLACILLLISGILMIFCSYLIQKFSNQAVAFRYLGIFTLLLSLYMCVKAKLPPFLFPNPSYGSSISLLALMLAPLPYLLFLKFYINEKYHRAITILFTVSSLNFIICILLQLTEIADLIELLFSTIMIILAIVIFVILHCVDSLRTGKSFSLLSLFALFFLISALCAEAVQCVVRDSIYVRITFQFSILFHVFTLCLYVIQSMLSQKISDSFLSEKLLKQQINMMISHVQPHFVFNSLGAIQSFIKKAPDTAYQMMFDFSKYLRSSMMAWEGQPPISFATEVEYIKAFTNIQLIRFHNSFHVIYDIQCDEFFVPLLSIRALVENSVNHGIRKAHNIGTVLIKSYELPDAYVIEVIDSGVGFDTAKIYFQNDPSSGLQRIQDLLKKDFNTELLIKSIPGEGTSAMIKIPK